MLCHPSALLLGPALLVPDLRRPLPWRRLLSVSVVVLLGAGFVLILDDGAILGVFARALGRVDPGRYDVAHFVLGLGYNAGPVLAGLALLGLARVWTSARGVAATLAACAGLPLLVLLVGALLGISMHQRYALAAMPAALVLAGFGVSWAAARGRGVLLATLAAAVLWPLPQLWAYQRDGNRHDTRAVAVWLAEHGSPADIFVIEEHSTVELYLDDLPGFEEIVTVEAPVNARRRHTLLRGRPHCWVALKLSRLPGGYDDAFTTWLEAGFEQVATVGPRPPALVRHDNRYVIYRRIRRWKASPYREVDG